MINPVSPSGSPLKGLPPKQLEIGIITIEKEDNTIPAPADWNDPSTYPDRGIFGGTHIGEDPISDGNILYTNESGTAIQQLFYDESGSYFILVAVYPFPGFEIGTDLILNNEGAIAIFKVDGSQDIMASTTGIGNIASPTINELTFSHQLTCLKYKVGAENQQASEWYGEITKIELIEQPDKIGLNVGKKANNISDNILTDEADVYIDYGAVDFPAEGNRTMPYPYSSATAKDFGYVLALPGQTYKFRITTEHRGAFYAEYTFSDPATAEAGTIYYLTFQMMESAKVVLTAVPAKEWWFDQTFN